jgi:hypothetical protein
MCVGPLCRAYIKHYAADHIPEDSNLETRQLLTDRYLDMKR